MLNLLFLEEGFLKRYNADHGNMSDMRQPAGHLYLLP